ncbi:MAG: FAD-dependent oxidoreductase [Candidatus Babeliales bacterium]
MNTAKKILIIVALIVPLFFIGAYQFHQYKQNKLPDIEQAFDKKNIVPVVIIGSGPAGLSAALYTARAKLGTIVFNGHQLGGQLADVRQIENWPGKKKASGLEAIDDLLDQAKHFGAQTINDTIKKVNLATWPFVIITENNLELHALALIIATGRIAKKLNVPGVETYWGKGIGVCTICDAPFHKGQIVAVVGGGDTAGDRALQLAAYAKKVYMFARNPQLDASGTVQEYLKETPNIEILYNTELKEIDGDGKNINKVVLIDNKTQKTFSLPIRGLYFAIGYHPNSDIFQSYLKIGSEGFILLKGRTQHTNIPGVFAAGDVTDKIYGKAGVATGSGVKAGMDAIDFMQDIGFNQEIAKQLSPQLFKPDTTPRIDIKLITSTEQLERVIKENPLVLVDFYADYCPSCKNLLSYLEEMGSIYENKVHIIKINHEKNPEIGKKFEITSVPSFIAFKNGKLIEKKNTIRTKKQLGDFFEKIITK